MVHGVKLVARLCGAVLLSLLLVACGGGGGSDGGGSGGPPPVTGTGLVPPAPTAGATLVADARTVRPLIAGASWHYAGTDTLNGSTTTYVDTVTQETSGGAMTERASNAFNGGADTATVSATAAAVTSSALASLTSVATQQITFPELRSPVRLNDQVTVLDQQFADIGVDSDGDGKRESGDLGIYRIVVGMEDVALPNGPTQRAVRVDMYAIARIKLSSSGVTSPPTQVALQSTWYAEGLGVVKQRLTTPVSATSNQVVEEVLTYFDGITKGFGAKPATQARLPLDAAVSPGAPLQSAVSVVRFADHALAIGDFFGPQSTLYTAISSIDMGGNVTRTTLHTGVPRSGFVALGNQLIAVVTSDDMAQTCQVQLMHFDAHGARVAGAANSAISIPPAPGQTVCSQVPRLLSAADGSRLWLAMVRRSLSSSGWVTDLVVRPFDANGIPLAAETTVYSANRLLSDVSSGDGLTLQSASAAGGKLVVSYLTDASGSIKIAAITEAGALTQATHSPATRGVNEAALFATATGAVLFWQGPFEDFTLLAPPRGVLLGSDLSPLLSGGSSSLDAQNLPGAPTACVRCALWLNGPGDMFWVGKANLPVSAPGSLTFAGYKASAGALASQTAALAQFSLADITAFGSIGDLHVVPYADRMLVLATANSKLYTKVFWLP